MIISLCKTHIIFLMIMWSTQLYKLWLSSNFVVYLWQAVNHSIQAPPMWWQKPPLCGESHVQYQLKACRVHSADLSAPHPRYWQPLSQSSPQPYAQPWSSEEEDHIPGYYVQCEHGRRGRSQGQGCHHPSAGLNSGQSCVWHPTYNNRKRSLLPGCNRQLTLVLASTCKLPVIHSSGVVIIPAAINNYYKQLDRYKG